ncbi:MAG: nucleotidyl transferase AbiEii/AbiGii toxin family protein [Phycisphaerales bacterium]|nr:nucleotidyl transferase AbiEii/AbiGii toxin family protein [Phycisphaerales bacterium]
MIDRAEIDATARRLGVVHADVERDYVRGWLLALMYGSSPLAGRLVLKGGNCLRKAYFEHGRYSDDLDFACPGGIDNRTLSRELNALCVLLGERTGVRFDTGRTRVEDKRDVGGGKPVSEARLYFQDFYGKPGVMHLRVRLDVTQFDRQYLPVQTRPLIHPYSDAASCTAQLRCSAIEEVLASKLRCLLQRRHVVDLFDVVHGTLAPGTAVDLAKLLHVFYRITVFGPSPRVAKGLLVDLPFPTLAGLWERWVVCPRASRVPFDLARDTFLGLLERLIPGSPQRTDSDTFFASEVRRPIMHAADTVTLLRIRYQGYARLVEPYDLVFKVRKDGVGAEYLYVYDTTGGASGPGIKSFLPGDVQSVDTTDLRFRPRATIELKKAGSAERAGTFVHTWSRPPTSTLTHRREP